MGADWWLFAGFVAGLALVAAYARGLRRDRRRVLDALDDAGKYATDIAEETGVSRRSIYHVLGTLEEDGLVECDRDTAVVRSITGLKRPRYRVAGSPRRCWVCGEMDCNLVCLTRSPLR